MQSYQVPKTLYELNESRDEINPKPPYQRSPVWNTAKKQLLIDTILRGYDVPKLYFRKTPNSQYEYEVVDGQQRLRAVWSFYDGDFALGPESDDLPGFGDLTGKKHADLPTKAKATFGKFSLAVVEIIEATESEIRDLFRRLQEGESLTPAEKRHAMMGKMRDFISHLAGEDEDAEPLPVLPLLRIKNGRFEWEDWLSHVTLLDLADGPADLKAADLKKMYENEANFAPSGPVAQRIIRILNYMARVLKSEPPEMNIKWGFVDLYLVISALDKEYVIKGREDDFLTFFQSFELERRKVEDAADLIAEGHDEWDRDLYDYIERFEKDGAKRASIETRHHVYRRRVLRDIPDLLPKDPKRSFSEDERIVIWRRDGGVCQDCGAEVPFAEMHADHISPHTYGGVTQVDNGQTLCLACNTKKGSKI